MDKQTKLKSEGQTERDTCERDRLAGRHTNMYRETNKQIDR